MKINAKVIVAKCMNSKLYGIRTEKKEEGWVFTWAFPVNDKMADREQYSTGDDTMEGSFYFDESYPGCPYCGNYRLILCPRCNGISCSAGGKTTECNWCKFKGKVESADKLSISGGAF